MLRTVGTWTGLSLACMLGCAEGALVLSADDPMSEPVHKLTLPDSVSLTSAVLRHRSASELVLSIGVSNASDHSLWVEYGQCSARLRVYETTARVEPAIWDDHPDPAEGWVCYDVGLLVQVPPRGEAKLTQTYPVGRFVNGWPPPEGHLGVRVDVNGERVLLPAALEG